MLKERRMLARHHVFEKRPPRPGNDIANAAMPLPGTADHRERIVAAAPDRELLKLVDRDHDMAVQRLG